jgi:integrase
VATPAELAQLIEAGTARDALVVVWALESGARCGEMAAALWADIDLVAGEWRIPRSKSGHPRTVPLTPRAVAALERWKADPVTVTHRDRKPVRIHGHPVVLGGVTPSGLSSAFAAHCRRGGVEGLRLHDLRHTCATEMRRRGVHSVTIAAMLGHRSWQMVQRYQHVTQDDLRLAINAG